MSSTVHTVWRPELPHRAEIHAKCSLNNQPAIYKVFMGQQGATDPFWLQGQTPDYGWTSWRAGWALNHHPAILEYQQQAGVCVCVAHLSSHLKWIPNLPARRNLASSCALLTQWFIDLSLYKGNRSTKDVLHYKALLEKGENSVKTNSSYVDSAGAQEGWALVCLFL